MNVNKVLTKDYENKSNWTLGENKPNTNPIKANFTSAQRGDILDEGWFKSMNELEWRR